MSTSNYTALLCRIFNVLVPKAVDDGIYIGISRAVNMDTTLSLPGSSWNSARVHEETSTGGEGPSSQMRRTGAEGLGPPLS